MSKPSRSPGRSRARQPDASQHDSIRIAPLHLPGALAVTPAARLAYRNGPLIAAVEVFTIFWGSGWKKAPQSGMIGQLNQFFDVILTSALIDQLAEYSVAKYSITHGKRSGTVT